MAYPNGGAAIPAGTAPATERRYDPFMKPSAGVSVELDALSAYITSLAKVPRSPYRNPDGSFTAAAIEGRKIFVRAGCVPCHSGPDFTDSASGILHDIQSILPTSGSRLFAKLPGIDTPSLKGVWQSAPYYHDGRAATLTELFATYNSKDQMGVTSNLTSTELGQLVEYLMELDDEPEPQVTVPPPPPPAKAAHGACSIEPPSSSARRTGLWVALVAGVLALALVRRRTRRSGRGRR